MKRILADRTGIGPWVLLHLGRLFIAILFRLNRVMVFGEEALREAIVGDRPIFIGFWHGKMLAPVYYLRRYRPTVLASPSRDGALLSRLLAVWGYRIIPGSSNRRGREALRRMAPVLENREGILITAIDGPVGPAREAKPGSLALAARKGALLIPISGSASRHWTFWKSWDHFQLPKPFGRIVIQIGMPLDVDPGIDPEDVAQLMTQRTNEVEAEADALAAKLA
ncbi:MAG: DUF374 domain-containing protein [Fidelibacterota bacterium]|nr:MAG: DUF374 domain-containing protein [Candidatus Neomarinimicrobiota bacterium]